MIALVQDLLGLPYVDGGRLPGPGADCFGLVLECCRRMGRTIPDPYQSGDGPVDAKRWIEERLVGWRVTDRPVAGGVVELRSAEHPAHIGFVLSGTHFLHSLQATGAVIGRMDRAPWRGRIVGWYVYGA